MNKQINPTVVLVTEQVDWDFIMYCREEKIPRDPIKLWEFFKHFINTYGYKVIK